MVYASQQNKAVKAHIRVGRVSSLRREGIVAVAVLLPDSPVLPMDIEFCPLVVADAPTFLYSLSLGVEVARGASCPALLDAPASRLVRDNVSGFPRHRLYVSGKGEGSPSQSLQVSTLRLFLSALG